MGSQGDGVGSVPPVLFSNVGRGWRNLSMCFLRWYTWFAFTGGFPEIK